MLKGRGRKIPARGRTETETGTVRSSGGYGKEVGDRPLGEEGRLETSLRWARDSRRRRAPLKWSERPVQHNRTQTDEVPESRVSVLDMEMLGVMKKLVK